MKKILSLISVIILFSSLSFGQNGNYWFTETIDFEIDHEWIKTDTSITDNIWSIGTPSKSFFNNAYSGNKSIVTDTINDYPINNYSSFTLTLDDGIENWLEYGAGVLGFWHKYDTEPGKDGGYIEITYDNGNTWNNIVEDLNAWSFLATNSYNTSDTITGGIPAFSGNSGTWIYTEFEWWWYANVKECPECDVSLRFIFKSDSIQENKEGWLIDKMHFDAYWPMGSIESIQNEKLKVYPTPANDYFYIEFIEEQNFEFELYNNLGMLLMRKENNNTSKLKVNSSNLVPGIYFYKIYISENSYRGKVLIN